LCCAGGAQQALAQKVLLLTANATSANEESTEVDAAYNNLQTEFASQLVNASDLTRLSVLGNADAISEATFTDTPGPYDMVIVASADRLVHPSNWAVLQNAMANRWAHSILFFVDTCCNADTEDNTRQMLSALNAGTQSTLEMGEEEINEFEFDLSGNSPYSVSFYDLDLLKGSGFAYINNVPGEHTLYRSSASIPTLASGLIFNKVYSLIIPTIDSNAGQGACVFAVVDINLFYDSFWSDHQDKLGPAFFHAATSESGGCGRPAPIVRNSFDKTDLYLDDSDNTSLLTITLSNSAPGSINNVNLTDNLPAPLVVGAGAVANTCKAGNLSAAAGSNAISNTGFTIPPGGCTITVPVSWPNTDAGRRACINTPLVTNTITPGTDFVSPIGQVKTPAIASLNCRTPTAPGFRTTAVPMLGSIKLALMVAAIALLGMLVVRRVQRR